MTHPSRLLLMTAAIILTAALSALPALAGKDRYSEPLYQDARYAGRFAH